MEKRFWFKRKLFGWGWVPHTWEGWLVTALFLVQIIMIASSFEPETPVRIQVLALLVPTLLLIAICYMMGEPPRWQWGKRNDEVSNSKE